MTRSLQTVQLPTGHPLRVYGRPVAALGNDDGTDGALLWYEVVPDELYDVQLVTTANAPIPAGAILVAVVRIGAPPGQPAVVVAVPAL